MSVEPITGRADLREGFPICTGGFGEPWHEPVNMAIDEIKSDPPDDGLQEETWLCPTCQQRFWCRCPIRRTS